MPLVEVIGLTVIGGEDTGFVFGRIVNDPTKVAVGTMATEGILMMAAVATTQEGPLVVDMPDEAVVEVLELP